jgi:hypothetical protein
MSRSTVQFITQMKLRELRRQRALLRDAYRGLADAVAREPAPAGRLRRLYDGLRGLKFAGQPLHPEVVNLEILFHEAEAGTLSPAVLALWGQRLDDELAAGHLRAEFVYVFGALLEEWAREPAADPYLAEEGRRARTHLLEAALADPGPDRHLEVLGPLFDALGPGLADLTRRVRDAARDEIRRPVDRRTKGFRGELDPVMDRVAKDAYQPAALRREARRFAGDDEQRNELADALTILLTDLAAWDWPADPPAARALWTSNKWRLYPGRDLATACLLEIVGDRWVAVLDRLLGDQDTLVDRKARLKKLLELNAPQVIIDNERRMLRIAEEAFGLGAADGPDSWEPGTPAAAPEPVSVAAQRAESQRRLRSLDPRGGYDDGYGGTVAEVVRLVHAEVRLARAAFPDRPLYVAKLDLRDFYASIPHGVLLTVLRRLGVDGGDLEFFARFLAAPLGGAADGSPRLRRGVPMNYALSGMLAELLLRLLERHVTAGARVRVVRLVDDICLLTPDPEVARAAFRRVEEFCAACGLAVNREKSGAVALGGRLPDGLPSGRPRWGMLELDEEGRWAVHRETFLAHLEQSRARVAAAGPVLSKVQIYNANADYLIGALALGAALGDEHRAAAGAAIREFHQDFFGPGRGVVAGLAEAVRERFRPEVGVSGVPDGWAYWPVTAGGLGLKNPVAAAGQYAEAYRRRKAEAAPADRAAGWDVLANDWGTWYGNLLTPVDPVEPEETKVMKTLVEDFIARGADLTAGRQQDLAPYWRWVLYVYGPQILQQFGTFRFLITELVPLQLISRQRLQDASQDAAGQDGPAADDAEAPF